MKLKQLLHDGFMKSHLQNSLAVSEIANMTSNMGEEGMEKYGCSMNLIERMGQNSKVWRTLCEEGNLFFSLPKIAMHVSRECRLGLFPPWDTSLCHGQTHNLFLSVALATLLVSLHPRLPSGRTVGAVGGRGATYGRLANGRVHFWQDYDKRENHCRIVTCAVFVNRKWHS